jgi:hypothetical protein
MRREIGELGDWNYGFWAIIWTRILNFSQESSNHLVMEGGGMAISL